MNTFRLLLVFVRIGALNELAYRANFIVQTLETIVGMCMTLSAVVLVFRQTQSLGGWDVWQLTALIGVYYLMLGVIRMIIAPSFEMMMADVRTGALDFTLLKPVDSQVLVSIRQVQVWRAAELVLGTALLGLSLSRITGNLDMVDMALFGIAFTAGTIIVYSFWLMLATLVFWFVRIENVMNVFWSVYLAGRWPIGIYPRWLRVTLVAFVPIAFAVTVPAQTITGKTNELMLGTSVALALIFLAVSRVFWKIGIRHYSGASA